MRWYDGLQQQQQHVNKAIRYKADALFAKAKSDPAGMSVSSHLVSSKVKVVYGYKAVNS